LLWKTCGSRSLIGGLRLVVGPFALLGGGNQIAVLQRRQKLSLPYLASPFDVKSLNRRRDLWHDRRLLQGDKECLSPNDSLYGSLFCVYDLDSNGGLFFLFMRAGCQRNQWER